MEKDVTLLLFDGASESCDWRKLLTVPALLYECGRSQQGGGQMVSVIRKDPLTNYGVIFDLSWNHLYVDLVSFHLQLNVNSSGALF